jgi:hypothetical protein
VPRHGALGGWLEALDEQRMRAVERLAEARIAVGRPDLTLRELGELIALAPLRSRGYWLKMLAHHRLGETDRALAVYRSAVGVFRDELGIEPDPQLTDLYRSLLRWDPAASGAGAMRSLASMEQRPVQGLRLRRPATAAAVSEWRQPAAIGPDGPGPARLRGSAWPPPRPVVRRTPEPPVLDGRERTLAALHAAVLSPDRHAGGRVVVVYGPPGVGTSAVALRTAHDLAGAYPDGQLHLDLRAWPTQLRTGAEPARAALRMLGVGDPPRDPHEAGDLLRAVSAGQRLLLVLDNVSAPGEARPLLSLAEGCCTVVTCGYPLGAIAASERIAVRPLSVAESLGLMRRLLGPDRDPENLEHLAVLCGGLPLVLRIVAARLIDQPSLTAATLIGRLRDDRRALAELETDDLSWRARLAEVWSGLGAGAQRAFARLGQPGLFQVADAAHRLAVAEPVAEALLDELVRAHLVVVAGPGRYRTPRFARLLAAELAPSARVSLLMGPSSA